MKENRRVEIKTFFLTDFVALNIQNTVWLEPLNTWGGQHLASDVALDAQFTFPGCLEFDLHGNLWIMEYLSHCIRMLDTRGIVTTVLREALFNITIPPPPPQEHVPRGGDATCIFFAFFFIFVFGQKLHFCTFFFAS